LVELNSVLISDKSKEVRVLNQYFSKRSASNRVSLVRASFIAAAITATLIAGCAQTPPSPAAPESAVAAPAPAPVVAAAAPAPVVAAAPAPAPAAPPPAVSYGPSPQSVATSAALTPSGQSRYRCDRGGSMTNIALPTGSEKICSRFPAMGPCQYERDQCRANGGRVIRFDGVEITKDVEHEYDRQVQRFRLNAG
jgi:hypothetical protein